MCVQKLPAALSPVNVLAPMVRIVRGNGHQASVLLGAQDRDKQTDISPSPNNDNMKLRPNCPPSLAARATHLGIHVLQSADLSSGALASGGNQEPHYIIRVHLAQQRERERRHRRAAPRAHARTLASMSNAHRQLFRLVVVFMSLSTAPPLALNSNASHAQRLRTRRKR